MTHNIGMQTEEVQNVAKRIEADSQTIVQMMEALTSLIGGIAGESWKGASAVTFQGAWDEWQGSFTALRNSLDTMPPALEGLVSSFEAADQSLTVG